MFKITKQVVAIMLVLATISVIFVGCGKKEPKDTTTTAVEEMLKNETLEAPINVEIESEAENETEK